MCSDPVSRGSLGRFAQRARRGSRADPSTSSPIVSTPGNRRPSKLAIFHGARGERASTTVRRGRQRFGTWSGPSRLRGRSARLICCRTHLQQPQHLYMGHDSRCPVVDTGGPSVNEEGPEPTDTSLPTGWARQWTHRHCRGRLAPHARRSLGRVCRPKSTMWVAPDPSYVAPESLGDNLRSPWKEKSQCRFIPSRPAACL